MSDIKLVCLDLDETLITHDSWLNLGLALGMSREYDRALYEQFKAGEITYEAWNNLVLKEYIKHDYATREGITRILTAYTYAPGAREAVDYLRERDYELVLISGSIDILVAHVAHDLGISYYRANNTFVFDESDRLVNIHTYGDDTRLKAEHLESFCDLLDIKMTECACIGDGANDLELFRRTGHGITFHNSPIAAHAWKIIGSLHEIPSVL